MYLVENTLINNNYRVIQHILTTKECILYKCIALNTNEHVIATEYFPSKIAYRNEDQFVILPAKQVNYFEENLGAFSQDAEIIMNNDPQSIFGVLDVFSEKGTCYIITRMDGELLPFKEYFIQNPDSDVTLYFSGVISACSHFFEAGASIQVMENNVFVDKKTSRLKFAYLYEHNFEEKKAVSSIASMFVSAFKGKKKIVEESDEEKDEFLKYLKDVADSRRKVNTLNDFEREIGEMIDTIDHYKANSDGLVIGGLRPNSVKYTLIAITAVITATFAIAVITYFMSEVFFNPGYKTVVQTPKHIEIEFDR